MTAQHELGLYMFLHQKAALHHFQEDASNFYILLRRDLSKSIASRWKEDSQAQNEGSAGQDRTRSG